jgi:hypothetical protein
MNEVENVYWLFTAAAQSIAALIAFLLAGVTLAFSMMDRTVQQDATLDDVIEALRKSLYRDLRLVASTGGAGILASLVATFLNPFPGYTRDAVVITAAVIDVIAVVGAVIIVIRVVSPERYASAAKKALHAYDHVLPMGGDDLPASTFFHKFIQLEKRIREMLESRDLYVSSAPSLKMRYSFREMVNALYQNDVIKSSMRAELLELNKKRNLLFHGHVETVDSDVLSTIDRIHSKMAQL